MTNQSTIYQVGGSLPQDTTTYALRKADTEIFQALMAGEFCYVLNSRQMGKSSLRVQTMKRLQEAGVACGCIDFTMIGKENIPVEMWYSSLIVMLVSQFKLSGNFDEEAWFRDTEHIAPLLGFGKFIESVLLATISETIVIFLDEIDSIIKVAFKDDFFAFIRSCYNKRAENPVYNRLSFCLLGVATPADLIQDKQRTPFNIGRDIELTGFTFEEAKTPLLPGLVGKVDNPQQVLGEILTWTGGQPFLTQKLCKLMVDDALASPLLRGTGGGSIDNTSELGSPLTPLNKGGTGVEGTSGGESNHAQASPLLRGTGGGSIDNTSGLGSPLTPLDKGGTGVEGTSGGESNHAQASPLLRGTGGGSIDNTSGLGSPLTPLDKGGTGVEGTSGGESNHAQASPLLRGTGGGSIDNTSGLGSPLTPLNQGGTGVEGTSGGESNHAQASPLLRGTGGGSIHSTSGLGSPLTPLNQGGTGVGGTSGGESNPALASPLLRGTGGGSIDNTPELGSPLTPLNQGGTGVGGNSGGGSIHSTSGLGSPLTPLNQGGTGVAQVARTQIIDNWVSQDKPEHLKTIRDRILRNEQRASRLLGLYQQVLDQGSLAADGSDEQTELRLSGLVVERDGYLKVNNRIYGSVFDRDWVKQELARLRPYSEAFTAWVESGCKDESRLLRGVALQDAQDWGKGKSLSDLDYQFLAAGQELDRRVLAEESRILAKANDTLTEAQDKAKRIISIRTTILGLSLIVALLTWIEARENFKQSQEAKTGARLEQQALSILRRLPGDNGYYGDRELLYSAMETGQQLFNIVKDGRSLDNYPAIIPIYALHQSLTKFKENRKFRLHEGLVNSVRFSPDGNMLATPLGETVRLFDLQGKQLALLKGHQQPVTIIRFSPDGNMLATASDGTILIEGKTEDKTVRVWDLQGNQLAVLRGHQGWVRSVSFSRDGKMLATASHDNPLTEDKIEDTTVRVWDLQGNQLAVLRGHQDWVNSISFSPDGKTLATASHDKTARVWDLQGNSLAVLRGHQSSVSSVSFSRDGKTLATASWNTVRVWDLQSNPLALLRGHQDSVTSVSFSRDGKMLATASNDKTVRLWDLQGNQLALFQGHQDSVNSVSFSRDGKTLATASWNTVRVWDLQSNPLALFQGHQDSVTSVSFSRDGKMLATASNDTVRLWDLQGNSLAVLRGHQSFVYDAKFNPDGKMLATASSDTVRLWDLQGNPLAVLKGHQSSILSVSFSPDGQMLATASWDKTVRLWDLQGNPLALLRGHQDRVNSVSFSPNGQMLATASRDNTVRLWDLQGNPLALFHPLALLKGHQGRVNSLSFSRDGKMLATASSDGMVRLWAVENLGEMLARGCKLLEDYFVEHPEDLESLSSCQDSVDKVAVAPGLVKQGEKLAKEGDVDGAIAKFQKAQEWNPELELEPEAKAKAIALFTKGEQLAEEGDVEGAIAKFQEAKELNPNLELQPETKAKQLAAPTKVKQGKQLAIQGELTKALSLYKKAQQLDPNLEISAYDWNEICWFGSLHGYAADVMDACEKAVAKEPEDGGILDSRGLAKALTGDTAGAISYFQAFVDWIDDDELKAQRQKWIDELRAGKNPFTEEVLKGLLEE
ncbi:AAA-like domain-containing protein [Moorena sp. SIO4A1]|uniref:WD40 domain-containing protein n=1 Tax=Moorena sp. SIO4A1 TaxID=2607835 RepID=UPI0025F9AB20|nr:AAA-like domain-containing protein [Moorena sp. SIO4A1]